MKSTRKIAGAKRRARVVLAFDLDCFYASVVVRADPSLAQLPVGVVQKHLVVTCNYVARALGVKAMSAVKEAVALCPQLVLVDGSDLSPFRRAAAEVRATVRDFLPPGTPLQWLGLDEIFVDASAAVAARASSAGGTRAPPFSGHVRGDLCDSDDVDALARGAELALEIRALVKRERGLTMRAGIGASKLASKLAAGLHKPDDQTTFLSTESVALHLAARAPSAIPGFGRGYCSKLRASHPGVETTRQLLEAFPPGSERLLASALECSESAAKWTLQACVGGDDDPVVPSGPPKLVSNQDAMRGISSRSGVLQKVRALCRHVLERLADDADEYGPRQPSTLVMTYRLSGTGYKPTQRAVPMPVSACSPCLRNGHARFEEALRTCIEDVVKRFEEVLEETIRTPPFSFSLLGIGATNFRAAVPSRSSVPSSRKVSGVGIASFMTPKAGMHAGCSQFADVAKGKTPVVSEGAASGAFTCPICAVRLPLSTTNERLNLHVDSCMTGCSSSVGRRKRNRHSNDSGRIEHFFQSKRRVGSATRRAD